MVSPGWYHAPGDEPGTIRLWNGAEWVGFAQPNPTVGPNSPDVDTRPPGQVLLRPFALLAQLSVLLVGAALVILAFALRNSLDTASAVAAGQWSHPSMRPQLATLLFAVLAAVVCVTLWSIIAHRNISLWRHPNRPSGWRDYWQNEGRLITRIDDAMHWDIGAGLIVAGALCFVAALQVVAAIPMSIVKTIPRMFTLVEQSPRRDERGAIGPITAVVWAVLLALPGTAFAALAGQKPGNIELSRQFLLAQLLCVALLLVSALFAIALIWQITNHQDRRRRLPTAQPRGSFS